MNGVNDITSKTQLSNRMAIKLIADGGSTKTEWCLLDGRKKKTIITQGISPYFLTTTDIQTIITGKVVPELRACLPDEVYFYGTGCSSMANAKLVSRALKNVFKSAHIEVTSDLLGAAKALCGDEKGIACILGTGSNSCYYNGKKIVKNSPGLGYVLGDEGSGAYLGKRVIQHYLYNTFDEDLMDRFLAKFNTNSGSILEAVYKGLLPNRYMASYTIFLAENRGHYMIENIIEDGFNDFFFNHVYKYSESWTLPIHFTGSVAYGFRDVLKEICSSNELQLGRVIGNPMEGLIKYHEASK